jgi:hypothetical protein
MIIYEELLVVPHDIRFNYHYDMEEINGIRQVAPRAQIASRTPHAYLDLKILQTCRQIYNEASPILYQKNCLDFEKGFWPDVPTNPLGMRILHAGPHFPHVTVEDGFVSMNGADMSPLRTLWACTGAKTFELFLDAAFHESRIPIPVAHLHVVNAAVRRLGGVERIVLTFDRRGAAIPSWVTADFLAEVHKLDWKVNT